MALEYRYAELRAIPPDVEQSRTVEFVISDETKDRNGTRLLLDRWELENYEKNPIVGYQHNLYGDLCSPPNPDDIIGKSVVYKEGKQLIGKLTFEPAELNKQAEKIFQKVIFGTLRMASVGFIGEGRMFGKGDEAEGRENQTEYFKRQELLEWSIVNIPSNPSASKREFSVQSERALRYIANIIGGKLSIEELKKMTVNGILRMVTGESEEYDKKEREFECKIVENKLKIKREQEQLRLKLRLMGTKIKEDK